MTDIPQWAIIRAREELAQTFEARSFHTSAESARRGIYDTSECFIALARYIEKHEHPPVDPWEVAMRAALRGFYDDNFIRERLAVFRQSLKDQGVEI